ncbi:hypothetical protein [Paenochrobactrum glaciei]|uniref:hypothetical protein n=1 Tax=Paenochrobactrum glaciei TaxID=486407 RepID=UPI0035BC7B85
MHHGDDEDVVAVVAAQYSLPASFDMPDAMISICASKFMAVIPGHKTANHGMMMTHRKLR